MGVPTKDSGLLLLGFWATFADGEELESSLLADLGKRTMFAEVPQNQDGSS